MSRAARTLAASALGAAAVALTAPAAPAAPARPIAAGAAISLAAASADGPSASVSPATVHRGRSVTLAVTCAVRDEERMPRNISGEGRVLRDGTVTLERQGSTGTYRGTAQTAPRVPLGLGPIDEAAAARADARAAWAIEGVCPDSAPWSVTVRTTVADPAPSAAPHTAPSGPPAGNAPAPGRPHRELPRPEGPHAKKPGPDGPASEGPRTARPGTSRPGAPHGPVAAGGGGAAQHRPTTEVRFAELARITAGDRSAATLLAAGGAVLAATAAGGYLLTRRRERGTAGHPEGGAARP
ncbi:MULTISPECIES: hypothetical protein [Streptomyces]|uniref:Gram-positive cocci surface proteins LPxTG domain-containing protein n=1 Tax=Streptomyces ramulosus TaxID=47762 RepID=A0ABW1FP24_9ACTN